mgnify:CR=1 FL=1
MPWRRPQGCGHGYEEWRNIGNNLNSIHEIRWGCSSLFPMYVIRPNQAQRRYLDELASVFPELFKPDQNDYARKMLITISQPDSSVLLEIVSSPPRLPVEVKLGGSVLVEGHEVESGEKKLMIQSIVADLITAIDIISPRDKEVIAFHPTQQ